MNSGVPPLSPRLAAVAGAIAPGSGVADLGTDHGKLPLWLAATGRAAFCLATEKDAAMLERVARAPEAAAWSSQLAYRAGDGLAAIRAEDRIDTVVLAGLGGRAIVRILSRGASVLPDSARLVLQPRSETALTRAWLSERGWRLVLERLDRERGRFHATLAAERGADADLYDHPALSREDLLAAGPILVRSGAPEVERFWRFERERLRSILRRGAAGASIARARAGLARSERVLEAISTRA
jgi:tRNA (adenine22-N1)-methyltransferase